MARGNNSTLLRLAVTSIAGTEEWRQVMLWPSKNVYSAGTCCGRLSNCFSWVKDFQEHCFAEVDFMYLHGGKQGMACLTSWVLWAGRSKQNGLGCQQSRRDIMGNCLDVLMCHRACEDANSCHVASLFATWTNATQLLLRASCNNVSITRFCILLSFVSLL